MATTSTPLPGLGGGAYRKIEGDEYQRLANAVQGVVFRLLNQMHSAYSEEHGATHGDGGPIIQGALGAILGFALLGDISDDDIRRRLQEGIDTLLPQMRMAKAAGGAPGGHA